MTAKALLFASALLAISPAYAFDWQTDDGRKVTQTQVDRDGAYCNMVTGGRNDGFWRSCMLSRGYIIPKCGWMDRCF